MMKSGYLDGPWLQPELRMQPERGINVNFVGNVWVLLTWRSLY